MTGKSKNGMSFRHLIREITRNWTNLGTGIFCNILVDRILLLSYNWDKGLQTETFFRVLQKEFHTALFLEDNRKLIPEGTQTYLDTSIEKLRNKYNDRARTDSRLDVKKESKWLQIMHPVLIDTNTVIDSLSFSVRLSFQGSGILRSK